MVATDFDAFSNRGEYFSAYYFAERLGDDLQKALFTTWNTREDDDLHKELTPRQALWRLRQTYLADDVRPYFRRRDAEAEAELARRQEVMGRQPAASADAPPPYGDDEWRKRLAEWHRQVLTALGYPAERQDVELTVHRAGQDHTLRVAFADAEVVALDCGWAADNDSALEPDGAGRLLKPLRIGAGESYDTGAALASWLFHSELVNPATGTPGNPPRFVLLLVGGVMVLADRTAWGERRYLAVSLDTALEHNDRRKLGELAVIGALFGFETLRCGDNGTAPLVDTLLRASGENAVGVSGELRHGLQRSVELIANEVLDRLRAAGVEPAQVESGTTPFAKELTSEALRYLYRILFLLYAEARPELGILPTEDEHYQAGYSLARLREIVARDPVLTDPASADRFHLYESLDLLFRQVNAGHRPYGSEPDDDQPGDDAETREEKAKKRSRDIGLRFDPLHSALFEPAAVRLIGRGVPDPSHGGEEADAPRLDLRLRNHVLHEVLRRLTMKRPKAGERGGFISYRNLGINELGKVYEGLMSFTGFVAEEDLFEVAKDGATCDGRPRDGSWMVPVTRADRYPDEVFVEHGAEDRAKGLRGRKRYPKGSFVYRLAGRDRATSASYYTPESLTKVTVELTLKHRLDQERDDRGEVVHTRAAELLRWRICEPALGSGAFLNEAINQVAAEYLKRRQEELGRSIPASEALTELQRVKAYIALHNTYGIDLNATGVELAEVSLWLNTMHPGMRAPWFGLHLRRGNSLIGARRAVFGGKDVEAKDKPWLRGKDPVAPTDLPLRYEDGSPAHPLPSGAVHQFLLPALGWGAVAGSKEAKELDPAGVAALTAWRKGIRKAPTNKGGAASQLARIRKVAQRAEYLWSLVVQRMALSEKEIARAIDVWGADRDDPEYDFMHRPTHPVPKEKVYRDLFESVGTPYWRLKTVMDAWCALWFWPVDKVGLLDGSDAEYAATRNTALPPLPEVGVEVPAPRQPMFVEHGTLFAVPQEQGTLELIESGDDSTADRKVMGPARTEIRTAQPGKQRLRRKIPLTDFADWLDFCEALLGTGNVPERRTFSSLDELEHYEDQMSLPMHLDMDTGDIEGRFPWLHVVRDIAEYQGFLHWELEFAHAFAQGGGFDLQVGNPPWVRPKWDESSALAEIDPWFQLTEKPTTADRLARRDEAMESSNARRYVLAEVTTNTAVVELLGSPQVYPLLAGTQPDLYRGFMCQMWAHASAAGTGGMVHPDTHFVGDREGLLRVEAYSRLRVHGDFVNAGQRFFPRPVGDTAHFGVHIYGSRQEIAFDHLSWLVSADALRLSSTHDGTGAAPGIRYEGEFDERPHRMRVVRVNRSMLALWRQLLGDDEIPVEQSRLLSPVSTAEAAAIAALAAYPQRLGTSDPQTSSGFHESGAKRDGLIDYKLSEVKNWSEVVLKGIQMSVATPLFKRPDANSNDPNGVDLTKIASDEVPVTEYVQVSKERYEAAQDRWIDHQQLEHYRSSEEAIRRARQVLAEARGCREVEILREDVDALLIEASRKLYTAFYRLSWRKMIASNTERSLYATIIPPGVAHIDGVHSLAVRNLSGTALSAGFWAALPLDYLLRITGRSDLRGSGARMMPMGSLDHVLAPALLLRTLRLNCLTTAYANLWSELYDPAWQNETWAIDWPGLPPLNDVTPDWRYETPLRTERARRSALVEIDALVSVWLGVDADALTAMYRARFPVLQKYEDASRFDANGRKIAGNARCYGHGQTKAHWLQLQAWKDDPDHNPPPDGYTPPFYKAKREREMRRAHAVFQARLDAASGKS